MADKYGTLYTPYVLPKVETIDSGSNTKIIVGIIVAIVVVIIILVALWLVFWRPKPKFTRVDANYVSDPVTDATSLKFNDQENRDACEKVCLDEPKCMGYTWFDTTTTSPKKCVGIPGAPHSTVPSTQHFSGKRN